MQLNNNWRPQNNKHSINHRIFTDQEEAAIKDFIVSNFLSQGRYFNDEDFIEIAYHAYLEKYQNEEKIKKDFLISRGFIKIFWHLLKQNISYRKFHIDFRFTKNILYI